MNDKCTILAKNASITNFAGKSLAATLYDLPVTIALTGSLGAGKTTFLQGCASALGINDNLTSPTYPLEQRYAATRPMRTEFLHLDLYRLTPQQSKELLCASDDFPGIRCIEWSERIGLEQLLRSGSVIHVDLQEGAQIEERTVTVTFHDAKLLTDEQIAQWRRDAMLPDHIIDHCEAVASFSGQLAEKLISRGHIVRKKLLTDAARIHDLLRFLDFHHGGHPDGVRHSPAQERHWDSFRTRFPGMRHEAACAQLLRDHGCPALALVVEPHGLHSPPSSRHTIEQKILFYADKRVMLDMVVTLEERFADFAKRYGNGTMSDEAKRWMEETRDVERELFPEGIPLSS